MDTNIKPKKLTMYMIFELTMNINIPFYELRTKYLMYHA